MSLVGPRPCLPAQKDLVSARESLGVFECCPGITGLAQIQGIDMSTPEVLARVDFKMIRTLTLRYYFSYIIQTMRGKGSGDKVRR